MRRGPVIWLLVGCAAWAFPLNAIAQDVAAEGQLAEVDGGAVTGALGANIVAGAANQQANVGLVAAGGTGMALAAVSQSLTLPSVGRSSAADASVADGAFAGSIGWIATNVGAGSGNQQANLALIGIGLTGDVAGAALLSQTRASTVAPAAEDGIDTADDFHARIGEGAFEATSGLVQVNVAAGDGNTSANVFALTIPGQ